jgi:penicillin-binding protein 1C
LTLAEAALIAGLPQSPSRYRPDKYLEAAIRRRGVVLDCMVKKGTITRQQSQDAQSIPVVMRKSTHPPRAWHAAWMALKLRPQGGRTCIDLDIQSELERLANEHYDTLPKGSELAVVIIDISQSSIVGMVGSGDTGDPVDGQVNGVLAKRSPGSALKPFIYAAAFEAGRLNGESIVHDIPIRRAGWSPANFDQTFRGEIAAAEALRRSLNIPAILIAEETGLARCCGILDAVGIPVPANAQTRSGLSLAVGGMEVTLLDLTNAYATLGRSGIREKPRLFPDEPRRQVQALAPNVCAAIDEILSARRRRPVGMESFLPEDVPWFMWKTGTSSGRRDAWAVGHNRRYAIGVWVGRFRGTGRVAYVGAESAEPLLAGLFDLPALRVGSDPPVSAPIIVRRPLSPPAELKRQLQITSPGNGETFICLNRETVIRPAANYAGDLLWFLNGRLVDNSSAARLVLTPGYYELHCVDQAGQSSKVCFDVR